MNNKTPKPKARKRKVYDPEIIAFDAGWEAGMRYGMKKACILRYAKQPK